MRYRVKVRFGDDILEERDGEMFIGISSKPKLGRANRELVAKIASYFDVSPSSVKIISGIRSRSKIVEVEGL